uniref:Trafficking protein particle complex subunit 2-like protein n=1 Tax=Albugo laibachii Nc14 TaxID=890382 RepID=F0WPA2_9STRA|nr:trafficking protein particle complex subunit 2like protein putative [Albugo laibachii Nc14]|eukprot:CCA23148.1 trafficking protein particle complex subunit 2like protein putative [Albugo laibachii Nc14]
MFLPWWYFRHHWSRAKYKLNVQSSSISVKQPGYPGTMLIACVAVVGAANNPLYLRTFDEDEDLTFHHIVHVSLDLVEEKLRAWTAIAVKHEMYLGFLSPVEDYRVYGYIANTNIKLIAVLQQQPARDSEIRTFLEQVHKLYVDVISNPFTPIGECISSAEFEKGLCNLVAQNHNTHQSSHPSASLASQAAASPNAIASSV